MQADKEHHNKILVSKTAHYYTRGQLGSQTRACVWAFHGYGQRASGLLGKFDELAAKQVFSLAPEGLSRFYWEGVSGDVVSSWMTSEDRYDEIADQVSYLNQLYERYPFSLAPNAVKILFGFSQGCATLWRWILNNHIDVDLIILWAGWLPEDMDYAPHLNYLQGRKLICVYGRHDEYLTENRVGVLKERFADAGIRITYFPFNGTHKVDRIVLGEVMQKFAGID